MSLDENGNPVIETDPGVVADPPPADSTVTPDLEDPSSSTGARRKPGAEERISQLVAEREFWRGKAEAAASSLPVAQEEHAGPIPTKELDPNDFNSDADYLKAVAKQTKDEIRAEFAREKAKEKETQSVAEVQTKYAEARKKYPDFDTVALDPSLPVTATMFDAAKGNNVADILHALGSNRAEAARIASLPPIQQVKEIGKIESRLTSTTTKKVSSAPSPPSTISGGGGSPLPKKEEDMSWAEKKAKWAKEREDAVRKKYA